MKDNTIQHNTIHKEWCVHRDENIFAKQPLMPRRDMLQHGLGMWSLELAPSRRMLGPLDGMCVTKSEISATKKVIQAYGFIMIYPTKVVVWLTKIGIEPPKYEDFWLVYIVDWENIRTKHRHKHEGQRFFRLRQIAPAKEITKGLESLVGSSCRSLVVADS